MKLESFGPVVGWSADREDEAAKWLRQLPAKPKLIVVFAPHHTPCRSLLKLLDDSADVVVGATTGGAAFTERGAHADGIVIGALLGDDVEVVPVVLRNIQRDTEKKVKDAVDQLVAAGLSRNDALLVLADGIAGGDAADGDVFMSYVTKSVPLAWRVFGGRSGDHFQFNDCRVFFGGEEIRGGAVFVRLKSTARIHVGVQHGWQFVDDARQLEVTAAEGLTLATLEGRPAAEVYREELRRLGIVSKSDDATDLLPRYPIAAQTPFGEKLKPRAVVAFGAGQTLALGGRVAVGDIIRIAQATPEALIEAAKSLGKRVRDGAQAHGKEGSIVFDCAGRVALLGTAFRSEVSALLDGQNIPCVGMACYGELAKFGSSVDRYFNNTVVMATW
jgi:hypothetical protein